MVEAEWKTAVSPRASTYGKGRLQRSRTEKKIGFLPLLEKLVPHISSVSRPGVFSMAALALLVSAAASATETAPEKAVGISGTGEPVALVDLVPHQLPGAAVDYDLRARLVKVAPGGAINNHPHAGRPGIVRVVSGTVIEYRGSASRTLKVGEFWTETSDVVHWFRNPSTTEGAELWVVDLVPRKK
jgi:quercetin dioxygenase-like cupin family protein